MPLIMYLCHMCRFSYSRSQDVNVLHLPKSHQHTQLYLLV
nr:MAG TPA: hypothetical protein [Caudoviricetes sp.]